MFNHKTTVKQVPTSRLNNLWKEIKRSKVPYTYIAPFYILFGLFGAFPILYAFYLSFQQWDGLSRMRFIGLQNYKILFNDPLFWRAAYNTLFIGIVAHIPMLLFALFIAFIVNSGLVRLKEVFRTIYFLPVITSSVAISIVFLSIYGVRAGLANYVLTSIGLPAIDWWGGFGLWVKPAIIIMFMWKWVGWNMVIYLAGLQSIPSELYEAASIDGANMPQTFFRITLPLMKPIILFSLILSTIGALTIFDEPYMLVGTGGGTDYSGLTLMVYLYREAFEHVRFGYASAIAYMISTFIVIVAVINMKIFGRDNQ